MSALLCLSSCVGTPELIINSDYDLTPEGKGAYILCEGSQGQNNTTLWRYSYRESKSVSTQDYFNTLNPTLKLGDTGNSLKIKGDTAYIAITSNGSIELFTISTGKSLGRIFLPGIKRSPRDITIVNDSVGYISDFHSHSLTQFNPTTFEIKQDMIAVGYAPESIVSNEKYVFVANSGFGDYAFDHPEIKAQNVSVVDISMNKEIALIPIGPNVQSLQINTSKKLLYALFTHLPRYDKDSLGGIVEIDLTTLKETRRWLYKVSKNFALSLSGDSLLLLNSEGLSILNTVGNNTPKIVATSKTSENWYGVHVSPFDGTIFIANAKQYTTKGEVLIYDKQWNVINTFQVGINPNAMIFFQ
ncbi:MAG: hypothetical protein IPM69_02005 [Ignavibacteria bacterium]|nr:hypothetical protein [Ignavibacteria bacterium]